MRNKTFIIEADEEHLRFVEGREIPSATASRIYTCGDPECDHVHIVYTDATNKPVFEAVLSPTILVEALQALGGTLIELDGVSPRDRH